MLDVWLQVPLSEIHHVVHILPTLDWKGGKLGVRLVYALKDIARLKKEFLEARSAAKSAFVEKEGGAKVPLTLWPISLSAFLERTIRSHVELRAYPLDPSQLKDPVDGRAVPQALSPSALPLQKAPFVGLIKVDEIAAQRDFTDAGDVPRGEASEGAPKKFKRRLSEQLRSYYDKHIDPLKMPGPEDFEALEAIQEAERSFDKKLKIDFEPAIKELEDLGYPGVANPKLKLSTQLRAIDGIRHNTAVQYEVADSLDDGSATLRLPEDYSGLGYQNLVAMVFMLMSYRDDWMRVGKASKEKRDSEAPPVELLHLVLVEEPEAHLHAQVQQVFINKAFALLRKHKSLGDSNRFCTQLIVSTHSSHVAHEVDFASLRYFRRRPAASKSTIPTTTVANLSSVFGGEGDTARFVKRYLKATHCDLFFADGIVFVEGQAERVLVPHFIRTRYPALRRRYITLIDLGGSHAHRFRQLVEILGLVTLVISDLDATAPTERIRKDGKKTTVYLSAKPETGSGQKTSNPVLKYWFPCKESIDELVKLKDADREFRGSDGYRLCVAHQMPIEFTETNGSTKTLIPRTFEDALVLENVALLKDLSDSKTSRKISDIVEMSMSGEELADALFALLKTVEKAEFAIDCLMMKDAQKLVPPGYIRTGLDWFQKEVDAEIIATGPQGDKA
jgi:predicted ATP-dependent endonuclease of OLD family